MNGNAADLLRPCDTKITGSFRVFWLYSAHYNPFIAISHFNAYRQATRRNQNAWIQSWFTRPQAIVFIWLAGELLPLKLSARNRSNPSLPTLFVKSVVISSSGCLPHIKSEKTRTTHKITASGLQHATQSANYTTSVASLSATVVKLKRLLSISGMARLGGCGRLPPKDYLLILW